MVQRMKYLFLFCCYRDFPIRLENPHVISGNQIWAGVAPVGPSGYSFNSSYRSRGSVEYKLELGNAIGMQNSVSVSLGWLGIFCRQHLTILLLSNLSSKLELFERSLNWSFRVSQLCPNCTRWAACFLPILLSFGAMHKLLENYGKVFHIQLIKLVRSVFLFYC